MITQRPGFGTEGTPFRAVTNFHAVRLKDRFRVDISSLDFDPPLPENTPAQRGQLIEHNKAEVLQATGAQDLICTGGNLFLLNAREEMAGHEIKLTELKPKHYKEK